MNKKKNILYGILGGLLLFFMTIFKADEIFETSGFTWFISHGVFMLLSAIGIIAVVIFSLYYIFTAFKELISKDD
ncbi:hypothetical protein [Clostridium sp. JN-9]|uniref:hypothetical protein n=1 Tax=Clostridium sp. JN-9 TaxID=2507159 RepID=UPI000FFDF990|nr:hypothetical protein [Clostridium sp. JN-9]QAT39866.1 hypothetical protein EQM05_06160 [Clostridium sp. JN-9]